MTTDTRIPRDPKHHARSQTRLLRRYPELRELEEHHHLLALEWAKSSRTRLGISRGWLARWMQLTLWLVSLILLSLGTGFFVIPELLETSWDDVLINQGWINWPLSAWPMYIALGAILLSPMVIMLALSTPKVIIRRGFRKRSACHTCHYVLTGTKPTDAAIIECPECRTSLAAFSCEFDVNGRFAPWKPTTKRSWGPLWPFLAYLFTLFIVPIAVLAGYGAARLVYRYQVHQDAKLARAWMPTEADFNAILAKIGPQQTEDRRLADGIASIKSHLESISTRLQASLTPTSNLRYFDVTILTHANSNADEAESRRFTQSVLDTWLAEGGEAEFLKLLQYPLISAKYDPASEVPAPPDRTASPTPEPIGVAELRYATRLGRWMVQSAMKQGDQVRAEQFASVLTKFSEQFVQTPTFLNQVFALNSRMPLLDNVHDQLQRLSLTSPPSMNSWLDSLSKMLDQDAALDRYLTLSIEGEALFIRQSTARTFLDARSIADGSYERALRKDLGYLSGMGWLDFPEEPTRLGSFEQNRLASNQITAWLREAGPAPRWLRPTPPQFDDLLRYSHLPSVLGRYPGLLDSYRQATIALRCLIALERYRLQHDDYPESLDLLPGGPFIDLYNQGKPLQYRKQSTPGRPIFLLYSVGVDGIDHQARPSESPLVFWHRDDSQVDNVFSPNWNQPPTTPTAPKTP
jgi:hypothetical protein